MQNAHLQTPGPWDVHFNKRGYPSVKRGDYPICSCPPSIRDCWKNENWPDVLADRVRESTANANLIAAAPELLAALTQIVNFKAITVEGMKQARSAIAKARGPA